MADKSLALVIGANRGIGLGVVKEMLHRGWSVIATARRPDAADALKTLAAEHPGKLDIQTLDMTDFDQVAAFADGLKGQVLDAVLVNAGVSGPGHMSADKATEAEIGGLMFTNAIAPIRLARALAGLVRPKTGVLAFTSSIMGSVALNTGGHRAVSRQQGRAELADARAVVRGEAARHHAADLASRLGAHRYGRPVGAGRCGRQRAWPRVGDRTRARQASPCVHRFPGSGTRMVTRGARAAMIPVSIVTGFLGSGKTTLIGRILRDPAFARTAVIINGFGEIGLTMSWWPVATRRFWR